MSKRCTVCAHPKLRIIDGALVSGESVPKLARRVRLKEGALYRHRLVHLPDTLLAARGAAEIANADALMEQIVEALEVTRQYIKKAGERQDYRTCFIGIREWRRILEFLALLAGKVRQTPRVNLLLTPEWIRARTAILDALQPYPEARLAVATAVHPPPAAPTGNSPSDPANMNGKSTS